MSNVDQYYNNSQNEFLWKLLANPADDAHLYADDLQRLVNNFPQSGVLHALLAHASEDKNLRLASVYFNARALYKLINAPSTFIGVPRERVVIENSIDGNGHYRYAAPPVTESLHSFHEENTGSDTVETYLHNTPAVEDVNGQPAAHELPVTQEGYQWITTDGPLVTETSPHTTANETVGAPVENMTETVDETSIPAMGLLHHHQESGADAAPVERSVETQPEETQYDLGTDHQPIGGQIEVPTEVQHYTETAYQPVENEVEEAPTGVQHYTETVYQPVENEVDETPAENKVDEVQTVAPAVEENIAVENVQEEVHGFEALEVTAAPQEHEVVDIIAPAGHPTGHTAEAQQEETKGQDEETETPVATHGQPERHIADEVFDEIVSIEQINLDAANPPAHKTYADEEALINGGIASSDFFTFDKTFGEHKKPGPKETPAPAEVKTTANGAGAEHHDVSKYHDEKMPYTFMWWLDKTRKEHGATYQPYIKPTTVTTGDKPKKAADELQQQYFENIFHITSVEELDKNTLPPQVPYAVKPKGHTIIERFIKEEPQIRPQSSEKIDNENKAKKSSEDRDEMVTETLAAIYSDQMLYHKAIASYKKLMLKFPEKSRYFAAKIEQLEKKTN